MAIKQFPHAVIYDGKFYPPNAEIIVKEVEEKDAVKATAKKAVNKDEKRPGRKA